MNEFIMKIGYAVLDFFGSIDVDGLGVALKIMGTGMLGIFVVTAVIIGVITLLGRVFQK